MGPLFNESTYVVFEIENHEVRFSWRELASWIAKPECILGTSSCNVVAQNETMDVMWLLFSGCLVLLMQGGFIFLELGSTRIQRTTIILTKSLMECCLVAVCYYLVSFTWAWLGGDRFIGYDHGGFLLLNMNEHHIQHRTDYNITSTGYGNGFWFYTFSLSTLLPSIVSTALVERVQYLAYMVYSVLLSLVVVPIVFHWGWSNTGWASPFSEGRIFGLGAIDYAGSGVIHAIAGMAALVAIVISGPRRERFGLRPHISIAPDSATSTILHSTGTLLLCAGFFGIICGSSYTLSGGLSNSANYGIVNGIFALATSGISTFVFETIFSPKENSLKLANNGVLGGLVAVSASCAMIEPAGAIVIGFIASIIYMGGRRLLIKNYVDDSADVVPIHLFCGSWGTLAAGLFTKPELYHMVYGVHTNIISCGALYSCKENGLKQFGANAIFLVAICIWSWLFSILIFFILQTIDILRISKDTELGLIRVTPSGYTSTFLPHSDSHDITNNAVHFNTGTGLFHSTGRFYRIFPRDEGRLTFFTPGQKSNVQDTYRL